MVGGVAELPHSQISVVCGSGVGVCLWAYETPRHPLASSMSYRHDLVDLGLCVCASNEKLPLDENSKMGN